MKKNKALARQRGGKLTFGPGLVYDSPDAAEQVARIGFDWVWIDWQHGQWTEPTLKDALSRFLDVDSAPIVRVASHDWGAIGRVLDMGAMGVMVPMVQDAAQAAAIVQATYYVPKGRRSAGGVRLGLIGDTFDDYIANANDEIMLVVMVETEAAIANVEAIMRTPGVDVVLIGPGDLMIDVKANGHDAAHHERLVLEVAAASKATGTAAGYVCGNDAAQAKRRVDQGFRFVNLGLDHFALLDTFGTIHAQTAEWAD